MTVREIVTADEETLRGDSNSDSVLRTDYTAVTDFGDDLQAVVKDLTDTLRSDTLSVGLAAPQIGYPLAVAVVNLAKSEEDDLILVNPEVVSESGSWDIKYESCMSVPHKRGQVKRRKKVQVRYQDVHGNDHELATSGFEARVILHEIDHLQGVLYVDRMEEDSVLEDTELFREHGIK